MGFFDGAAGGIASGIGGIVSSIFGNKAQRDANKANLQIAQMNNDWSERMMEKQHAYDLENRDYNTPDKQVARLRAAGLNPALAMQNVNTGNVTSQSASLPSPSQVSMQPLPYTGIQGFVDAAVNTAMQIDKNMAEIDYMRTQSDVMKAKAKAEIAELGERTKGLAYENDYQEAVKSIRVASANEQYLTQINDRLMREEQTELIKQQIYAQKLSNANLPDRLAMELAVMASQRDLNKFNAKTETEKLIDAVKKRGFKLTKSEEGAIFDAVIMSVHNMSVKSGSIWDLLGTGLAQTGRIKAKLQE